MWIAHRPEIEISTLLVSVGNLIEISRHSNVIWTINNSAKLRKSHPFILKIVSYFKLVLSKSQLCGSKALLVRLEVTKLKISYNFLFISTYLTLEYQINMPARLLIFRKKYPRHAVIWSGMLIKLWKSFHPARLLYPAHLIYFSSTNYMFHEQWQFSFDHTLLSTLGG